MLLAFHMGIKVSNYIGSIKRILTRSTRQELKVSNGQVRMALLPATAVTLSQSGSRVGGPHFSVRVPDETSREENVKTKTKVKILIIPFIVVPVKCVFALWSIYLFILVSLTKKKNRNQLFVNNTFVQLYLRNHQSVN